MVVTALAPAAQGLTTQQAAQRLLERGPNRIPGAKRVTVWQRLGQQLRDPLIIILLVAVVLTIATGDHPDAIIITVVIVLNCAVGVAQELRADQAMAALQALTAPEVRVIRDGVVCSLPAEDLVPDDVILLAEGDIVPADAVLLEAAGLRVDESALTGESVPVDKDAADPAAGSLSAGTVVVHGRGQATVTRTGAASALGVIAAGLKPAPSLTPLQRRLAGLGRVLGMVAGVLCVVVMTVGLLRGQPAELMVVTAISLVVAAVPESLPAVVTLSLALGARRMAARQAIVRRLAAVETLGSVTVIATDKTGTLTEGAMVAELIWTPRREAVVTGGGYEPSGTITDDTGILTAATAPDVVALLRAAVLCSDAELQPPTEPGERWRALGDPTEAAFLVAAAKIGIDSSALRAECPRLAELPFDSDRKRMTTVHRLPDGSHLVVCKGAPERVLAADVLTAPASDVALAAAQADAYADRGDRVLAVAAAVTDAPPADLATAERGLRLLGLVGLADPPRATAAETVFRCRAAGITPVLITGDHVATARAIAERVGVLDPAGAVSTGAAIDGEPPDPQRVSVFARTDPAQKLQLVRGWREQGQVVAMQGDGVNDAPSLRQADIGVAMGGRGTEIARQAADIVLTNDDLGTVVAAIEEGRRVYANVRRFLLYGLAGGTGEILVMLFGPAVGLALPLLPAQILWVNLLTHGLPGVAMGAEPVEPGTMHKPPRPPAESVIGAGLWPRILVLGTLVAAAALGAGLWGHAAGRPWQTMVFFALGATQFGVALGVRARPRSWANPFLLGAVACSVALQLAALYLPALQTLLHTRPLTGLEVGALLGLSTVGYAAALLLRHATPESGS